MASIFSFPLRSDWARVATLCVALLVSASVHANPANCDDDMTDDQKFQRDICSSHAGCALVFAIHDSCVGMKNFLGKLGLGGKKSGATLTDNAVNQALIDSGVSQSSLANCTFNFDRALCRDYLGIEKRPGEKPEEPIKLTREQETADKIKDLLEQASRARGGLDRYNGARIFLDSCAASKGFSDRQQTCDRAQRSVDDCNSERDKWGRRKAEVLAELRRSDSTSGIGPLASTELPPCPYTLPQTSLTPAQALVQWAEEDNKAGSIIVRCDAMRRDTSDALDNNELDRAAGLVGQFEAACSRENQTYADLTRLYKQRLAEARAAQETTALPRRSGSSGAEMFQQAINQAEQDERDRPAREARERAAKAAAERDRPVREARERAAKAAAVTAEARQTPEDRLRKSYDQRITAAREQCAASKESCDSGCTGVAVVGLLTMFASKGAGADEASAQIQQCSNRCDGAKSSCDQQVSNLEQEKLQAIANARNPQRPTASSSGVAQAPSSSGGAFCVAEQQRYLSFSSGGNTWADINKVKEKVAGTMTDQSNYVSYRCPSRMKIDDVNWVVRDPRDPPICNAWAKGAPSPSSPNYDQALMLMVDVYTIKANEFLDPRSGRWNAEQMLLACVARHMANQIKGAKPSR